MALELAGERLTTVPSLPRLRLCQHPRSCGFASALAMAEMKDLVASLDKLGLESTPQPSEGKKAEEKAAEASSPQQPKEKQPKEASPPQSSEDKKTEDKATEEASPPQQSQEEKAAGEASPPQQPDEEKREEATYKVAEKKADESTPPSEPQPSSAASPPGDTFFASPDEGKDDILEFTSATEGEGEPSSAWELAPEKKIVRKVGVKSGAELDHLLKKAVAEASHKEKEVQEITPMPVDSASASSTMKEVTSAKASPPGDSSTMDEVSPAEGSPRGGEAPKTAHGRLTLTSRMRHLLSMRSTQVQRKDTIRMLHAVIIFQ